MFDCKEISVGVEFESVLVELDIKILAGPSSKLETLLNKLTFSFLSTGWEKLKFSILGCERLTLAVLKEQLDLEILKSIKLEWLTCIAEQFKLVSNGSEYLTQLFIGFALSLSIKMLPLFLLETLGVNSELLLFTSGLT